ncbi:hypothetical protein ACLRGI_14485 [Paenarthrobacter nitroguajacolicus]|uniref:hypothetical protein n=1 Tax=Paenarthrobacter nitroguajacolicus TaxID=211146 RepID=UPI003AED5C6C
MSDTTTLLQARPRDSPKAEKKSTSQQLVELARDKYNFGIDTDGKAFGFRKGRHVVRPLTGSKRSVRQEVGGLFYRATGRPPSQNALTDGNGVLEYEAQEQGEPVRQATRAARTNDGELFVDIGNQSEQVLHVTSEGWEVLDGDADIPVLFRRTNLTYTLPIPEAGGDMSLLWEFVNMPGEADRALIIGWLVAAHILVGLPCPILAILGEQGTAKTTSARRLFSLIDPTSAIVRRPPQDSDSFLHAVHHSRGCVFDNLSSIPRWLSDSMCRFVTGEADVDRSLYTDGDARVIEVQGVMGFTSIDVGALAGDLAERCVWGDLKVILASQRRSERELNAAWDEAYPSMFGGLMDLVVMTLKALPDVHLVEKPRMADFAEVLAALDLATDSRALEHYKRAHESVAADIVDTDKFLGAISSKITQRWAGTGKELYRLLPRPSDDKYWPEERGVSGKLRRSAPDLRKSGWTIEEIKPDPVSKRPKTWVLVPPEVTITDAEIATIQLFQKMYATDIDEWKARALSEGATPAFAPEHASILRVGSAIACRDTFCSAPKWKADYGPLAERSKAIDKRLLDELDRLGLTFAQFDRLVADRLAESEEELR